ncbi:hypothetical protein [Oceanirhabdus sp. W0125-5]|uniref:hypothetical protein n=1 Tax=Oceanirhabdus sp. W0125-5 TaxID=2999116 RepID=UPI0022F32E65|nr:hypothetical protein [Oceanirhabdus sp. W0125-5]WBW96187.1 hypothetical protein OW730_21210 [Oceanirhabdus sp. W0125-5]
MRREKKFKIIIILLATIVIAQNIDSTYAWFMKNIFSKPTTIKTGDLKIKVNDARQDFTININPNEIFPGDYLSLTEDNTIEFEIVNESSVPIVYSSGFTYSGEDTFILNGFIIEDVIREVYNTQNKLVKQKKYFNKKRLIGEFSYIKDLIDTFNINGENGADSLISLKEIQNVYGWMFGNFKGYTTGMLKPGCKEVWKYKIKFHENAASSKYIGKSMPIQYKVYSGQNNLQTFRNISRSYIINIPEDVSEQYFNTATDWLYYSIEKDFFSKQ